MFPKHFFLSLFLLTSVSSDNIFSCPPKRVFKGLHYENNCGISLNVNPDDRYPAPKPDKEFDRLIRKYSQDNFLIVTCSTSAHLSLTLNWVEGLRKQQLNNFFIFCLDDFLCGELRNRSIPSAQVPESWVPFSIKNLKEESSWGSNRYKTITQAKSFIILQILSLGYNVVFSDVDIGFPNPGFYSYLQSEVTKRPRIEGWFSLEMEDSHWLVPYVNSGFYLVKPTPFILTLFQIISASQVQRPEVVDQFIFNDVLDLLGMKINGINSYRVRFLDPILFVNGGNAFHGKYGDAYLMKALTLHANYLVGRDSKASALKKLGLWLLTE